MVPAPIRFFSLRWLIPAGLFLATFFVVAATNNDYGVTWDEPPYFHASDLHIQWLRDFGKNLLRGDPSRSLQDESIKAAWHWDPYHVPHPPFSRIVSGLTKVASPPWIDKFSAYRLGPALFFAMLVTVMYLWMAALFDRATGIFSSLSLVAIPNLFGFAHIAVTDIPLVSMWFFTAFCFWRGLRSWRWSVALGAVWGLALATKFPALLIPAPLFLWAHIYHRRNYANNVCAMLFLSPIVMIASQPYLWHEPGLRILEFLYEGLSRGYRPETNYAIFFFGQVFYSSQLPWYYPFFVIGVTTPEPILAIGLLGSICIPCFGERKGTATLFLVSAVFILLMGLLPGAVLHDGIRQLMSVLPFLAALGGGGFFFLFTWLKEIGARSQSLQRIEHVPHKIAAVMMVLILFVPALDTYLSHPFQLSYYNRLVGGIRGAYLRGMEVTYFMEAITPGFLNSLNKTLPQKTVINASVSNFMLEYYKQEGRLRPDIKITNQRPFDYYVVFNRRSVLTPFDRDLLQSKMHPYNWVQVAGVPLVLIYSTHSIP